MTYSLNKNKSLAVLLISSSRLLVWIFLNFSDIGYKWEFFFSIAIPSVASTMVEATTAVVLENRLKNEKSSSISNAFEEGEKAILKLAACSLTNWKS